MILEIQHLNKRYRSGQLANDDIDLLIASGEVRGLLGHNGAGKTTLVNQVVGLVRPTSGRITIAGRDAVRDPASARRSCSLQPQSQFPLRGVTPSQATQAIARIRGATRAAARDRTRSLFAALDFGAWADIPGERLSGGARRLTTFCMAAAGPSQLVILDEPTNDVDPERRRLLWGQIRSLADDGRAVLVVTHDVAEAERGVDRLTVLRLGRVVAEGTPAAIRGDAPTLEDRYLELSKEGSDHAVLAS